MPPIREKNLPENLPENRPENRPESRPENIREDFYTDEKSAAAKIDRLQARIRELEIAQIEIEAAATKSKQMAEDLAVAREEAETALRQAQDYQEKIKQLAMFDPLTGLSNRNDFSRRFDEAIKDAKRNKGVIALLMFDLDKFKSINDSFGHPVGDALLKRVAEELKKATRETDTVARLGGDEFAVVLTHLDHEERATKIAERVISALEVPMTLELSLVRTGTSIGISLYPRDATEMSELMRTADVALYAAKERGRGNFRYFNGEMDAQARKAHVLESDMRLAIVRREFVLHYQPQLDAKSRGVIGIEALVRWQHPTRGLLAPDTFISAAENNGLVVEIGKQVLEIACAQCKQWIDAGHEAVRIAVNVSAIQFQQADFVPSISDILANCGLPAHHLELEITESLLLDNIDQVVDKLSALRDLGVLVSVDDFGTGYSSLAYLKKLPIQKLKIDKSFVDNLAEDADDMAIAAAIVNMGQSLGLEVIAEGIETAEQADMLTDKGCDQFQGYLFSKPIPSEDLTRWLTQR